MRIKHRFISTVASGAALLALAGCGGGGGGDSPQAGGAADAGTGAPGAGAPADTFVAQVQSVIADTSDTAEPRDVAGIQATTPENTEPLPLS